MLFYLLLIIPILILSFPWFKGLSVFNVSRADMIINVTKGVGSLKILLERVPSGVLIFTNVSESIQIFKY